MDIQAVLLDMDALMLEDSDAGIMAAAAAGMPALMTPDLKQPSAEAAATASHICKRLEDASEWLSADLHPF